MVADANLRINGGRLWDSLMQMAKIGATPKGGVKRLTLTDLDRESRDLFVAWCEQAGCTVSIDRMGSIFARRAGVEDSLPPVMVGSHLDTQPTGGKFDGALGVLSALEIVRTLNDLELKTRHPIEVAMWTNEEGSRFAPAMVASAVFAGAISLEDAHACTDTEGKTQGDEIARIGYAGAEPVGDRPVRAFFEIHIEQGPILEESGTAVGVVTHANGQRWYEVTLTGLESHAGPTPMERRRDALVGAARVIDRINQIGHEHLPWACATVGMVEVRPNSRNVIPGEVFLTVDLRHPDSAKLAAMDAALRKDVTNIAEAAGLEFDLREILQFAPIIFDEECVSAVRQSAAKLGHGHRDIVSGAGHDACNMSRVAPTAMVFTPCVDGISHNEVEDMKPEWATAGAEVLMHAVLEIAEIVEGEEAA